MFELLGDGIMKSDCKDYQKQIAGLLLGDLKPEEQKSLEEHLSECSICASEKDRYTETICRLQSVEDEPAPRHFFVHPQEMASNPWRLFLQLQRPWQSAAVVASVLLLLLGVAAISDLQVRVNADGWAVGFGSDLDVDALKADLMHTIVERDEASASRIVELREDIGGVLSDMASQQRVVLTALVQQDEALDQRISLTEDRLKEENRNLVLGVYDAVTKQRVQDLGMISLRLNSFENNYAANETRTNAILGALLQETSLGPGK